MLGLIRETRHVRHRCLHPVGHLVLGDPGLDRGVEYRVVLNLMQLAKPVEHLTAAGGRYAGWIFEVEDRVGARPKLHSLVHRGQEAVTPEPRIERLVGALLADQDAECR